MRPDAADEEVQLLTQRLTSGLGGYLILIVVGLFVPVVAVIGYLAIALYYVIPFTQARPHPPVRPRAAGPAGALTARARRYKASSRVSSAARRPPRPGPSSGWWPP